MSTRSSALSGFHRCVHEDALPDQAATPETIRALTIAEIIAPVATEARENLKATSNLRFKNALPIQNTETQNQPND